jgi:DNA-binding NarL/FixJ family response regulator
MAERKNSVHRISIWILEDHQVYRTTLRKLVAAQPWVEKVRDFDTGEGLLKEVKEDSPPDILLIDLGLPGISGIEVIHRVKRVSPATRALVLTVHDDEDKIFDAIRAGADGYLLKASSPEDLLKSIQELRDGGSPITAGVARKVLAAFADLRKPSTDYGLTERERSILNFLVDGISRKEIADRLFVSYHTIDFHIRNIYRKLQVNTQSDAVAKSLRERLL